MDRLSSPDQLDQLVRVTSPRSWLALIALAAIIASALLWGFVGQVPRSVSGQAILTQPGGITNVVATSEGLVVEMLVDPGDDVSQGEIVAHLRRTSAPGTPTGTAATPAAGATVPVVSPRAGRVVELLAGPGDVLVMGDPVVSLEAQGEGMIAYFYVPSGPGKQIDPGMKVHLAPSSADSAQYGYLVGRVVSVSEYPVTARGLTQLLNNDQLTQRFLAEGPILQVVVTLEVDPATESGFRWTTPKGPPFALSHGTLAGGEIVLGEQRPISLLMPGL